MLKARSAEEGAVAIIVSVFLVVAFAFIAFVADLGLARELRREAQNSVDAAALAAAASLYYDTESTDPDYPGFLDSPDFSSASLTAREYIESNSGLDVASGDWTTQCPVASPPPGYSQQGSGTNCVLFKVNPAQPTIVSNVMVTIPTEFSPIFFGAFAGAEGDLPVGAVADAELNADITSQCALCVKRLINAGTGDIYVKGGGSIVANDGDIQQNNGQMVVEQPGRIEFTEEPSPLLPSWPPYGEVPAGTDWPVGLSDASVTVPLITNRPVVDPFADLPMPVAPAGVGATGRGSNPIDCDEDASPLPPGLYQGLNIPAGETCELEGGLYAFTDQVSIAANSGTRLISATDPATGDLVPTTLYFTCRNNDGTAKVGGCDGTESTSYTSNQNRTGWLDAGGSGQIIIGPPAFSPFSIVYDRANAADFELSGNANSTIDGSIYAIGATVTLDGNGSTPGMLTINGQAVLGDLRLNGNNADLFVNAPGLDPRFRPPDVTLAR